MKLRMNIEGVLFQLNISDYRKSVNEYDLDNWTKTDLILKSSYLDYHIDNEEIFLVDEVEKIRDSLRLLSDGKMKKNVEMHFWEQDIFFEFYPKYDIRINPDIVYMGDSSDYLVDMQTKMVVTIWDHGITDNTFSMIFNKEETENLKTYLELITGEIEPDNLTVRRLMKNGILVE